MVDQLEAIDVSQVVHLLEPAWQSTHVLEALSNEFDREETYNGLMELSDGYFTRTLLLFASFGWQSFIFIQTEQANVIAVLVV